MARKQPRYGLCLYRTQEVLAMTNLMTRRLAASVCVAMPAVPAVAAPAPLGARPEVRHEVTLPAGTVLRVRVDRGFGSDTSRVEDEVHGTVVRAVTVRGTDVLPPGRIPSPGMSPAPCVPGASRAGAACPSASLTSRRLATASAMRSARDPGRPLRRRRRRRTQSRSALLRPVAPCSAELSAVRRARASVHSPVAAEALPSSCPRVGRTSMWLEVRSSRCALPRP